jgi:hypothetical protein
MGFIIVKINANNKRKKCIKSVKTIMVAKLKYA